MKKINKWISMILMFAMLLISVLPLHVAAAPKAGGFTVDNLLVDNVVNPVGIDNVAPRFSWNMVSDVTGEKQTAYQITVTKWDDRLGAPGAQVWDSGKQESDQSIDIAYAGTALESSASYQWQVTVWDQNGAEVTSETATFEMGLLEEDAFADTKWIRMYKDGDVDPDAPEAVVDKSVYTIEANAKFKDALGIVFAAKDNAHFYMWQFNNNMEDKTQTGSWLRPHVWNPGGALFNPEKIAPFNGYKLNKDLKTEQDYNFKLVVDTVNQKVVTYIDGEEVNTLNCGDADLTYGKIGFRQAKNAALGLQEEAWVDDLKVTANDGTILYYQDFSIAKDMQMDGGEIQAGRLYVTSGSNNDKVFLSQDSSAYYRFDTDFTIHSGKAGIVYGGNTAGSQYYYTQVNPDYKRDGKNGPAVAQHFKPEAGRASEFDRNWIDNVSKEELVGKQHHFTVISPDGKECFVYIDGVEAKYHDRLDNFGINGKIGFNSDSGDDVTYDNTVMKINGLPKLFTDYSDGVNPFENGSVTEGTLNIKGEQIALSKESMGGSVPDVKPAAPVRYDLEADITIESDSAGIVFSATDSNNMFMWQINGKDHAGKLYLRPHIWEKGTPHYDTFEKDISAYFDYEKDILGKQVHVKLEVSDKNIKTYIKDTLVDTFAITDSTPGKVVDGKVGFRSGTAAEIFSADNLKVTSYDEEGNANVKVDYDFEDGINPFGASAGQATSGTVKNGEFYINGNAGVILTRDLANSGMPMFRKTFDTEDKEIASAKIYATSLGVYDLYVNGIRVGQSGEDGQTVYDEMKPGWTDYNERVLYYSHDVTDLMKQGGKNAILALVGTGWWTGRISYNTYGTKDMAFLAKTIITYKDGTQEVINTDSSWMASKSGAIREADIWDGETYDANYPGGAILSTPVYTEDESWSKVSYSTDFRKNISAQLGQTIRVREELERKPEEITVYKGTTDNGTDFGEIKVVSDSHKADEPITLAKGETVVYDLGQNMVGWPNITVTAPKDTQITMHFAEMLNDSGKRSRGNDGPKGSLYTANYRSAASTGMYIANGSDQESYRPTFSFYGFRYVSVTANNDITIKGFRAEVLGSAIPETGSLETSNASVNKLLSNVLWGQRGNYLSVPTDCPQRDERLGWSGDTQVFAGAASYNANVAGFFHKWGQDARDSQQNGAYTDTIPRSSAVGAGNAAWGDAGIIVPYTMYKMYGDTQMITQMYDSMEEYMKWMEGRGYIGAGVNYGDWLAYESNEGPVRNVIACGYYAYDAKLMSEMSAAIGETQKAESYAARYKEIRNYFRGQFLNSDGTLKAGQDTQTCYLLSIKTGMFEPEEQALAVKALVKNIQNNGNKLGTGFVGTSMLNQVLSDVGETNMAYTLLLQRDNPSWLYSVDQGATTIWERWNSYTLENGFGDVSMNSFNHYSYGAVTEWMYSDMLGIAADETNPGFKHIILQPQPDTRAEEDIPSNQERIDWVKGSYDSMYGTISAEWNWSEKYFDYKATVPANTTATAYIPMEEYGVVTVNGKEAKDLKLETDGITFSTYENGKAVFEMEAGTFEFKAVNVKHVSDEELAKLKEAIDGALAVKETAAYTEATEYSKKLFDKALETAEKVYADKDAIQEEVDASIKQLKEAEEGLSPEVKYITLTDETLGITVKAQEGILLKDQTLKAEQITEGDEKELVDGLLPNSEKKDIRKLQILDAKGNPAEIEDGKQVLVTMNVPKDFNPDKLGVYQVVGTAQAEAKDADAVSEEPAVEEGTRNQGLERADGEVTLSEGSEESAWNQGSVEVVGEDSEEAASEDMFTEESEDITEAGNVQAEAIQKGGSDLTGAQAEKVPVAFKYTDSTRTKIRFLADELGLYVLEDTEGVGGETDGITNLEVFMEKAELLWDEKTSVEVLSGTDSFGENLDLKDAKTTYSSEDEKIAVVDDKGVISARNAGTTNIVIRVSLDGKEATEKKEIKISEAEVKDPVVEAKTKNSITLKKIMGYEYAIQKGTETPVFGTSAKFTGLDPATSYNLYQRIAATKTHSAGTPSIALTIVTDKDSESGGDVGPTPDPTPDETEKPEEIPVRSVKLNKLTMTLENGKTAQLTAAITPDNPTNPALTWTSSDTNVAKVSANGLVTTVGKGTAKITVMTSNSLQASCTVTVTQSPAKMKLNTTKKTLGVKEKLSLKATILPSNADSKKVTWKSSNKKVAVVDAKGKVTAKKKGRATITATTSNGLKAKCRITVKKAPAYLKLNAKKKTLKAGKTFKLKARRSSGSAGKITYTSSNRRVAAVTSDGKIAAIKKGKTVITAKTYNGKKAKIVVTVKK